MTREEKNKKIKETFIQTHERRKQQTCKIYTVKVQKSSLNKQQAETLKMLFVESKWIYNFILNKSNEDKSFDIFKFDYAKLNKITHFNKDHELVESELKYLKSSLKNSVGSRIKLAISNLAKAKKKGLEVGALKFISDYNAIDMIQNEVTHRIINSHKIKIQGIKKPLRVNGLKQIDFNNVEIANAKLIKKHNDYFIAITTFEFKKEDSNKIFKEPIIGCDMGCSTTLTLSNGKKFKVSIEETERLKRLQRKIDKSKKGSNNRYKLRIKLQKEFEHISNQKNDAANKIVHELLNDYQTIIIQDEQIGEWKENKQLAKTIQHSILGRLKNKLTKNENVKVLSKWVPTTKFCSYCGKKLDINLNQRTFKCSCGCIEDRDVHAAKNMVWFYNNIIGVECTDFKLVEFENNLNLRFSNCEARSC